MTGAPSAARLARHPELVLTRLAAHLTSCHCHLQGLTDSAALCAPTQRCTQTPQHPQALSLLAAAQVRPAHEQHMIGADEQHMIGADEQHKIGAQPLTGLMAGWGVSVLKCWSLYSRRTNVKSQRQ
jgi:hypothetical protein